MAVVQKAGSAPSRGSDEPDGRRRRSVKSREAILDATRGVVVVVYPEGVWYGGVRPQDVDEIIEEHVVNGRPVARLVVPDEELTGIEPSPPRADSTSRAGEPRS